MKKLALIAVLAAVPAWAQTQAPTDKPAAQAEPSQAQPAKVQVTRTARKVNPKRSEDARHCLEKATNTEIIKCAEAYL